MKLTSERIALQFGQTALDLRSVTNRATRRPVAKGATQSFLVRTPLRISDPVFLTEVREFDSTGAGARILIADPTGEYRAEIMISPDECGLAFSLKAAAPIPLWMVEWKLSGLDLQDVIVPALGGQRLAKTMPAETTLTYKYPFWWNAQFALGSMPGGGFWLHTRDVEPKFKLIRVRKERTGFALSLGFEADGPFTATTLEAAWHIDCYRGSWEVPTAQHRDWMATAFDLRPLEENPFSPGWARDINFVLEIWGMAKDRPTPLHTFDEMQKRLREFARLHSPRETLVYLPGFAEHGIDSRAPSYNPSPYLGGDDKFKELITAAHALGYRVMIHTNVLCMTFDHPLFQQFKEHQVVDAFGREQGWALDIDGDWLAEPYFAYMNPGAREWTDLMREILGDLIGRFEIDGVFLDQTLLAFNQSRGPNFQTGMREHIGRLQRAFPQILFAGEGYHELVAQALPMAQIHGIDSIAEVHGLEGRNPWRTAHQVSTRLFGKFTKFTAHLLTKHPSHPFFRLQEAAYAKLGVVPALCLYNSSQPLQTPGVRAMVRRARTL